MTAPAADPFAAARIGGPEETVVVTKGFLREVSQRIVEGEVAKAGMRSIELVQALFPGLG